MYLCDFCVSQNVSLTAEDTVLVLSCVKAVLFFEEMREFCVSCLRGFSSAQRIAIMQSMQWTESQGQVEKVNSLTSAKY